MWFAGTLTVVAASVVSSGTVVAKETITVSRAETSARQSVWPPKLPSLKTLVSPFFHPNKDKDVLLYEYCEPYAALCLILLTNQNTAFNLEAF